MITVSTTIQAGIEKIWEYFTRSKHIMNWYYADPSWHCPRATNNLEEYSKFNFTMASRDGTDGFDFEGTYTKIDTNKQINYTLDDYRKVAITFIQNEGSVTITETFDPENKNAIEQQQYGWQAILDNFKSYVEKE
jgi:uncharacterized protein YndB with AHSA1/START domain